MIRPKIVHIILPIFLFMCSCSVSNKKIVQVRVSPEPSYYAWWLRAEFSPVHKKIRGIPAHQLDPSWNLASELVKEDIPNELLFESGSDLMKESELTFSRFGDFNGDGIEDLALIGVYEDKTQKRGSFILILSKNKWGKWHKSFIEFLGKPKFAALSEKDPMIIWFCMKCDNGAYLFWDKKHKHYLLKLIETGG